MFVDIVIESQMDSIGRNPEPNRHHVIFQYSSEHWMVVAIVRFRQRGLVKEDGSFFCAETVILVYELELARRVEKKTARSCIMLWIVVANDRV